MKKYLAFDCSGEEIIVGASNGKEYKEMRVLGNGTELLLPTIDKCLKELNLTIKDIEVVGVGVGPGSWTGCRVGVVSMLGLVAGNPKLKVVSFNSFDLISYNTLETKNSIKLVRAYANFVYVKLNSGEILAITKDELNSKYSECKFVGNTEVVAGTEVVGENLRQVVEEKIKNKEFVGPETVEPMYLRLSQAEYQRQNKLKENK